MSLHAHCTDRVHRVVGDARANVGVIATIEVRREEPPCCKNFMNRDLHAVWTVPEAGSTNLRGSAYPDPARRTGPPGPGS